MFLYIIDTCIISVIGVKLLTYKINSLFYLFTYKINSLSYLFTCKINSLSYLFLIRSIACPVCLLIRSIALSYITVSILIFHRQVLEVVAALLGRPKEEVAEIIYRNACSLFKWTH